jgi:hypothetical protein
MAYKGLHNPHEAPEYGHDRPNPEGWQGGAEDFETVWSLKGHKLPEAGEVDVAEAGKQSRNHGRLRGETPGFC